VRARLLDHLRLYESAQILVPGLIGVLSQPSLPDPGLLLLYGFAYGSHVLSVYSFNDLSDYESDALNPRKAGLGTRSVRWLWIQTVVLTAIFLASVVFMPGPVRLVFLGTQILCMAYSHPRVRLKRRLLGSELAHFTAGFSYFATGVLVAGGDLRGHWLGGIVFGLLYLSGGIFNEIMDYDADREAELRHLVVLAGRRRALGLVFAIHYAALALLPVYEPSVPVMVSCLASALVYRGMIRNLRAQVEEPGLLLRFRRRYRLLFAALLVMVSLCRTVEMGRRAGSRPADPVATDDRSSSG
jgi:4-hydroxybenzoate polyprenyltransferase